MPDDRWLASSIKALARAGIREEDARKALLAVRDYGSVVGGDVVGALTQVLAPPTNPRRLAIAVPRRNGHPEFVRAVRALEPDPPDHIWTVDGADSRCSCGAWPCPHHEPMLFARKAERKGG